MDMYNNEDPVHIIGSGTRACRTWQDNIPVQLSTHPHLLTVPRSSAAVLVFSQSPRVMKATYIKQVYYYATFGLIIYFYVKKNVYMMIHYSIKTSNIDNLCIM